MNDLDEVFDMSVFKTHFFLRQTENETFKFCTSPNFWLYAGEFFFFLADKCWHNLATHFRFVDRKSSLVDITPSLSKSTNFLTTARAKLGCLVMRSVNSSTLARDPSSSSVTRLKSPRSAKPILGSSLSSSCCCCCSLKGRSPEEPSDRKLPLLP